MVLEATIFCLDNSEYMRNGDFFPTRMEAQNDAVNLVMGWKYQSNPENTVGVMKMAPSPEVLVTPSPEIGKILSALHTLKIEGEVDLLASIQVAQLALKHRQNKNQHQRMIIFIGSPLHHVDSKALARLGGTLKKNNVAVDVVSFGDVDANTEKLTDFIKAVNSNENSHLVTIESNARPLTDILRNSPIHGGGGGGEGASGGSDFEFGIDPNEDPELLLALRASLEDQKTQGSQGSTDTDMKEANPNAAAEDDEEELLRQAILMSLAAENSPTAMETQPTEPSGETTKPAAETSHEGTEKAEPTSKPSGESPAESKPESSGLGAVMSDPAFVNDILKSLPGVDFNDPQIKSILAEMGQHPEQPGSKNEDNDDELEKALKMSMEMDKKEEDKDKKGDGK